MSDQTQVPRGALFLSYAREDRPAAQRIAEALRAFGIETWIDQSELRGGDAWDHQIRRQIKDCALFVPLVSARTQSRGEGYFRLEWTLAEERAQHFARGVPFLVPVVIDDTPENGAEVPEAFLRVQWERLPGGVPTPQFVEHLQRLLDHPQKPPVAATPLANTPRSRGPGGNPWLRRAAIAGILALAAGGAWWKLAPARAGLPVVVLMDSTHADRVYDDTTRANGGSNADDITDALRGLPITCLKEGTNTRWHREAEILKEDPALIVIHRSAFCAFPQNSPPDHFEFMNDKLVAFLGYVAAQNARTRFIVYSRGSWEDALVAAKWREDVAHRFPALAGRVETWRVPLDRRTFRHPVTAQEMRDSVSKQLGLKAAPKK